jgi:hypothetical protein
MDDRELVDSRARNRFLVINLMRAAGVAMILFGIAIVQRLVTLPAIAGYVLIGLGLVETFVTPQVLARMWSSNRRDDPQ